MTIILSARGVRRLQRDVLPFALTDFTRRNLYGVAFAVAKYTNDTPVAFATDSHTMRILPLSALDGRVVEDGVLPQLPVVLSSDLLREAVGAPKTTDDTHFVETRASNGATPVSFEHVVPRGEGRIVVTVNRKELAAALKESAARAVVSYRARAAAWKEQKPHLVAERKRAHEAFRANHNAALRAWKEACKATPKGQKKPPRPDPLDSVWVPSAHAPPSRCDDVVLTASMARLDEHGSQALELADAFDDDVVVQRVKVTARTGDMSSGIQRESQNFRAAYLLRALSSVDSVDVEIHFYGDLQPLIVRPSLLRSELDIALVMPRRV